MVFLKRIEVYGFKSFADRLKIEFDSNIIGVVGPNGSGKSNINDAIRWVLGEQSVKSLRGDKAQDIIFSGAVGKEPLNMAEVTLVFNNSRKIFTNYGNEVVITRKIFRHSSENEYYINKTRVRLKDVHNLVLNTGLSKGSLAIISQGNVANFANAKPQERRYLFEEAAGIAKYKKRKEEALRRLTTTNENLNRLNDILAEITRKINPLAKQAEKAKDYLAIQQQLQKYEITLLVQDGKNYQIQLAKINDKINIGNKLKNDFNLKLYEAQQQIKLWKNKIYETNKTINNDEIILSKVNKLLYALEQQKIKLEKATTSTNDDSSKSEILQTEINKIVSLKKHRLELKNEAFVKLKKINDILKNLRNKYDDLILCRNDLYQTLGQQNATLSYINNQQNQQQNFGVTTILQNRDHLYGIIDKVANLMVIPNAYQQAITVILGNNVNNIVVNDDKDAIRAVNFLKTNKAGIVTFLPLNTIQVRYVNEQDKIIAKSQAGFLGFANEFIAVKVPVAKKALDFLLARNIICQDLEAAGYIAQLLATKYQCVSLDGQIIRSGGAIVGGYQRDKRLIFKSEAEIKALQKNITDCKKKVQDLNCEITEYQSKINNMQAEKNKLEFTINNFHLEINELENEINLKTTQYQTLTGQKVVVINNQHLDNVFSQYETNIIKQAEINARLETCRNNKTALLSRMQTLETQLYKMQEEYNMVSEKLHQDEILNLQMTNKMTQVVKRLVEAYNLTFENAQASYQEPLSDEDASRKLVLQLRRKLEDLGYVNINSIEEYEKENERYSHLKSKYDELVIAVNELMKTINEMDHMMINKFATIVSQVNEVLPITFQTLFGGGKCILKYDNPEDLLTTGIEVIASPPGKKVRNLNLLSGGEKSLVTLAVLFAVLKVNPLPLTILDEVEAPLDPANLERFGRYIQSFADKTQFIIVTHRPATMENCDVLYGITMEKQGITKIVNLKLTEAKKIINNSNKTSVITGK